MLGGARDWIRTSISLRTLRPEHSASTNFATRAFQLTNAEISNIQIEDCKYNSMNHFAKTIFSHSRLMINTAIRD